MKPLTTGKKKGNAISKGAKIGAGVKAVKNRKKSFKSDILTEFKKETNMIGTFPKNEPKTSKKKKSLIDEAKDVVKNKDKMPDKNVPENIKTGSRTQILMK